MIFFLFNFFFKNSTKPPKWYQKIYSSRLEKHVHQEIDLMRMKLKIAYWWVLYSFPYKLSVNTMNKFFVKQFTHNSPTYSTNELWLLRCWLLTVMKNWKIQKQIKIYQEKKISQKKVTRGALHSQRLYSEEFDSLKVFISNCSIQKKTI